VSPSIVVFKIQLIGPGYLTGARDITQGLGQPPLMRCNIPTGHRKSGSIEITGNRGIGNIRERNKNANGKSGIGVLKVGAGQSTVDQLVKLPAAALQI
jgi:hypothetical protein